VEDRYRLRAFIASSGATYLNDEGYSNFSQIYVRWLPDEHRYAIVETVDGKFVVWDLFKTLKSADGWTYYPPTDAKIYEDLDQAVAVTVLTYKPHDED